MPSGENAVELRAAREVGHCHHCFKQLMYAKGGGFSFRVIVHPDGHQVRVHHACWEYALGDGYQPLPEDLAAWHRGFQSWVGGLGHG